jgi:hypothetical protein
MLEEADRVVLKEAVAVADRLADQMSASEIPLREALVLLKMRADSLLEPAVQKARPARPARDAPTRKGGVRGRGPVPTRPPPRRSEVHESRTTDRDPPATLDHRISKPQHALLDALAWFEAVGAPTPRRVALAAVAKTSSKSSGFEKNISTLKTAGLIDYPVPGRVALTEAGRAVAEGPIVAPTEQALQEAIFRMVSGPQATLLACLIAVYPQSLSREELAEAAGVSILSSGFEKNVSTLKSFELVGYPDKGHVVALPVLFLD